MPTLAKIKLDNKTAEKIARLIGGPLAKTKAFFDLMGVFMDRAAMLTFRLQGGRAGHPKWKRYSLKTVMTAKGTWKIRYGTDLRGKTPRRKPMSKVRRFSASSKLLQASGLFRQSFGVMATTKRRLIYGTRHKLATKIMRLGREVLFLMPSDYRFYSKLFKNWYEKAMISGAIR